MSWLDLYVEYAKNNEAPEEFHFWTGLTILGAALRRNVAFKKGYYAVYPCPYTLIVAPSGAKKTTALSIGYNILSKLDHVRLLPDKSSPEALVSALAEKRDGENVESQGIIYAPELSNFMDRRQHNEGLVQLLLRLADCPDSWAYNTLKGGRIYLRNVAVTFLGATADDMIHECIPPLALKSGFLARFVVVPTFESNVDVVPLPWKDTALENEVLNNLYEISLLRGDMQMRPDAQKWYLDWYYTYKAQIATETNTKLRAYLERKPDHLFRTAMLLAIANERCLEYTQSSFEQALRALDSLEPNLMKLYEKIDATPSGKELMLLRDVIAKAGTIRHEELLRKMQAVLGDATNFKKLVAVLVESGQVGVVRNADKSISYKAKG